MCIYLYINNNNNNFISSILLIVVLHVYNCNKRHIKQHRILNNIYGPYNNNNKNF